MNGGLQDIDAACDSWLRQTLEVIADSGAARLSGLSGSQLEELLGHLGAPFNHPDDDRPGQTVITPRHDKSGRGFSQAQLALHTDRALEAYPPRWVVSLLETKAQEGGDTLLADSFQTLAGLADKGISYEELSEHLRLVDSATGRHLPVLDTVMGRRMLRLRSDDVARVDGPSALVQQWFTALEHSHLVFSLEAGQALALDNYRWAHGRTAFTGHRTLRRYLRLDLSQGRSDR